jgi:hypothetical protein
MTDNQDRRPLVVRKAHDLVWRLGIKAADDVTRALVEARLELLRAGFPTVHALCEDLDKDAEKWAAHATNMRRDRQRDLCAAVPSEGAE